MVMLEVHGVSVAFATAAPVIEDASLHLTPGWYGLVGANGAGKTTLLRILAGELAPHEGAVRRDPADASVVVCPQEVHRPDGALDIAAFAAADDPVASELRGRLDLAPDGIGRWPTLSPGERKRWQIGAALAASPDVLLLDEPTNHLDAPGRRLLVSTLRRFRGVGVVVSHDRALLDELPRSTIRVHDATVVEYSGGYSAAKAAWEEARAHLEEAHARGRQRVAAAATQLAIARRDHASADRARSSGARMKDKNDHDARSALAKGRAGKGEARAGRAVTLRRRELERAVALVPAAPRDRTLGGGVFAAFERARAPRLFHVDADALRPGGLPPPAPAILRDVRVTVGREDRVRVIGPNGAGKTTLLGALLAGGPPRDRVLYLPQELDPSDVERLAADLRALDADVRGRVLSVFAALGSDPERVLRRRDADAARLSPGEARKLALAVGLGCHAWALVLDEPTNHLDLPSIERLERALEQYPGALVLVTHDDAFASACTTAVLSVADGTVR